VANITPSWRCSLKHRLVIAFALGMLAGIVLWPNDSDSPDSGQQSVESPKISATSGRRIPTGPKPRSYMPLAEPALLDRGQMPQYGMRLARPENGLNEWERPRQYGYGLPSGPYNSPMYPNVQESTGYRFRPLNAASESDNGRRYTGNYQTSPHPLGRTAAPRWNESPAYGQQQPRRRSVPTFENQQPYFQLHSGDLYSAR